MGNFKGWTRRIIAIGLVLGFGGVLGYLAIDGNQQAQGSLGPILVAIVAFYFGSDDAEEA